MATILTDDFNSYTDGDLNTQGSWSADVTYDVEGTTVKEGAKAVQNADSGSSNRYASKAGTSRNDGREVVYMMKSSSTSAEMEFIISEGGTDIATIRLSDSDTKLQYRSSVPSWVQFDTYTAGVWFCVEIEWESTGHTIRYRKDSGSWTDWKNPQSVWSAGIDTVECAWWNNTGGTIGYWDYIAENPIVTTGIKSIDGLAKASIKSVNGLAIASVKSFNGLT